MKKIINAKLTNNTNVEILIDNKKIIKIAPLIDEICEVIDAKGGYVISGQANCYFDGNEKDVNNLLSQGVTSVFDFSFDDNVTRLLLGKGLKCFKAIGDKNGEVVLDREVLISDIKKYKEMGVEDIIMYAASPNLSEESNYAEIINLANEMGYLLSTNVSEALEDVGEIDNQYSMSPIGLLESYGFLDHKNLLISCVYVDKEDVNILVNYDTNICTCPTKNLRCGNGVAPVYSFFKNNINVVVGGTTTNHFKEISLVKDLQSGTLNELDLISKNDCINMASNNAHNIFSQIGVLREGEFADIVIVDDFDVINLTPLNVQQVLINGELKYERI